MSKRSIRHGGVVSCDMQTVVETPNSITTKDRCPETFTTYSESRLARGQAQNEKWTRVKAKRVKWPGISPTKPSCKVDLCPGHSATSIKTDAELAQEEVERKIRRAAEVAATAANREEMKRERKALRDAAKVAKPKKSRKRKAAPEASAEATP